MKYIAGIASTFLFVSLHTAADNCTHQLDGYLKGLHAIAESPHLTDDHKQQAQAEINKITQLRSTLEDCNITQQIPALKNAHDAVRAADNMVKGTNN